MNRNSYYTNVDLSFFDEMDEHTAKTKTPTAATESESGLELRSLASADALSDNYGPDTEAGLDVGPGLGPDPDANPDNDTVNDRTKNCTAFILSYWDWGLEESHCMIIDEFAFKSFKTKPKAQQREACLLKWNPLYWIM